MNRVFAIAALSFFTQVSYGQPVADSSPQKIRVLSWNIYMLPGLISHSNLARAEQIGLLLSKSDVDVIVFQEAFGPRARQIIRQNLQHSFPFEAGPANQRLVSLKTNSGIWILSRYPIIESESITFKNRHGVDAFSRKGALLVDLDVNGNRIQVAGTHLQNAGGAWVRHAQCVEFYERLLKPARKQGTPQIICGDFNIDKAVNTESYKFMLATLDASDGALSGTQLYTYDRMTNDLQTERGTRQDLIDYILLRENGAWVNLVRREVRVIRSSWHPRHDDLSDHYSVEAELTFGNFGGIARFQPEPTLQNP